MEKRYVCTCCGSHDIVEKEITRYEMRTIIGDNYFDEAVATVVRREK